MTGNTNQETLYNALMKLNDEFQKTMQWASDTSPETITLVLCNLNGFCGFLSQQMPLSMVDIGDESHATVDEL